MNDFFHLNNRSALRVLGPDSKQFLQGLITNDIHKVEANKLLYSMMLTPQGKFLYDFFITLRDDCLLLDCQASKLSEITTKLKMYKLRAQVDIVPAETFKVFASFHKLSQQFLTDPRNPSMGFRAMIKDSPQGMAQDLKEYELARINHLIPDADLDFIPEKSFSLEYGANMLHAIDYNKGCYIGQEPIARIHHRGTVRKKICLLQFASTSPPRGTEIICNNNEKIGITLGCIDNNGLGLINIEDLSRKGHNASYSAAGIDLKVITNASL